MKKQIIQKCTGAGFPDLNEKKLKEVMISVPDVSGLCKIDSFTEEVKDMLIKKTKLERQLRDVGRDITARMEELERHKQIQGT